MKIIRVWLAVGAAATLCACAPKPPSGPAPKAMVHTPAVTPSVQPDQVPGPTPAAGWRAVEGHPREARYGASLAAICDPAQQVVRLVFLGAPDDSYGPETATVVIDALPMAAQVQFRSPEDVAKDDPAAWVELPASPELVHRLGQAKTLSILRGDAAHSRIDTRAATDTLRRTLAGCG
jgi:hypothetical protein